MANDQDARGQEMRCSFCGKTRSQVRKLIAAPGGVYICDECVHECASMIDGADLAEAPEDEVLADEPPIKRSTTSSPSTSWGRSRQSGP